MRVTLALLADGANVSREGKLNILGVFDTLFSRTFPITHPQMQLVIRLEADATEVGRTRALEVRFASEDGRILFRVPGSMTIGRPPLGGGVRLEHILTLNNVQVEAPGLYRFDILVDGALVGAVPLRAEGLAGAHDVH